ATLMLVLVSITGHYGGNLTHGSTYLVQYAPQPVRAAFGLAPRRPPVESYASADPYHDLIAPMLELRCASCHNDDQSEADLSLETYEDLRRGGESGSTVVAGRPTASELYYRITLPSDDDAYMPAEGKTPLTDAQVQIVEWWITAGLPADIAMADVEQQPDASIEALIRAELGLGADD
ncbi:MAG: c-type cytochrome domain-containing protein, partial [Gammaproteobacteria bacterium]|nr:c-type cytochrome domain-containing protein [Gammaproteobacteria bacterium]